MPRLAPEETVAIGAGLDALVQRGILASWVLEHRERGHGGQPVRLWWVTLLTGKEWGVERKEVLFVLELGASLPPLAGHPQPPEGDGAPV